MAAVELEATTGIYGAEDVMVSRNPSDESCLLLEAAVRLACLSHNEPAEIGREAMASACKFLTGIGSRPKLSFIFEDKDGRLVCMDTQY